MTGRENLEHRLADSKCEKMDLLADLAAIIPSTV